MRGLAVAVAATCFLAQQPAVRFQDYPARLYTGPHARPDFSTHRDSRRFRSRVMDTLRQRPNFAGEWIVTIWGCGTSCQSGLMVSARTGRIVGLPSSMSSGVAHRANSRLLVLDPDDEHAPTDGDLYLWNGSAFVPIDSTAGRQPN